MPPPPPGRPVQQNDPNRQLQTALSDIRNEIRNHETEIRMFENRLSNQESSIDHIREQLTSDVQSQKDFARATQVSLQGKFDTLDERQKATEEHIDLLNKASTGLMTDLRQIKTQANDSIHVLSQYKQKLTEMEGLIAAQSQHIANLESALQTIMELMQTKESAAASRYAAPPSSGGYLGGNTYQVQPGDSLEKIARTRGVSIKQLKEINQLNNDRIIVGQTLKLP